MFKWVYKCLKKIVFGAFVLYGYNLLAISFDLVIPINVFTVSLVSFLGLPALFALILLFVIVF
ncbi:MAG: pro-sigmaK processing inhibitor BofA family protein [Bacilli bacterium]